MQTVSFPNVYNNNEINQVFKDITKVCNWKVIFIKINNLIFFMLLQLFGDGIQVTMLEKFEQIKF